MYGDLDFTYMLSQLFGNTGRKYERNLISLIYIIAYCVHSFFHLSFFLR